MALLQSQKSMSFSGNEGKGFARTHAMSSGARSSQASTAASEWETDDRQELAARHHGVDAVSRSVSPSVASLRSNSVERELQSFLEEDRLLTESQFEAVGVQACLETYRSSAQSHLSSASSLVQCAPEVSPSVDFRHSFHPINHRLGAWCDDSPPFPLSCPVHLHSKHAQAVDVPAVADAKHAAMQHSVLLIPIWCHSQDGWVAATPASCAGGWNGSIAASSVATSTGCQTQPHIQAVNKTVVATDVSKRNKSLKQEKARILKSPQAPNIHAGGYIAVRCDECTLDECRVTSRQDFGADSPHTYQKCHCYVKDVQSGAVHIQYVRGEHMDEWLLLDDVRIIRHKDEKWCKHGRVCNRIIRAMMCAKHNDSGSCHFCHDPACATACVRKRSQTKPAA